MSNYIIIDETLKELNNGMINKMAEMGRTIKERSNVEWYIIPYRIDPCIPYYKKDKKKKQRSTSSRKA